MNRSDLSFISDLETIVQERLCNPTDGSYTAQLASAGTRRIAQKVGEEAVELVIAATSGDGEETISEAADLIYHLIVLLAKQGLGLANVSAELARRHSATD